MATDLDRALVLTRVLDAPRELVFAAWVDPAQIVRWFGPRNIAAAVEGMEVRAGGSYRITLRATDTGETYALHGVYREVAPPERLVFSWVWEEDCPTHVKDVETVVTVMLRALGAKTELVLHHATFDVPSMQASTTRGWTVSLDRLAELLAGEQGRGA
jgi:uncharacterized protein YndB with AHSA1/START domain